MSSGGDGAASVLGADVPHAADVPQAASGLDARGLLAAIVASSDDAIIGLSSEGTILSWNSAAEEMFGYPAGEAVGRSVLITVRDAAREAELVGLLGRIRRGEHVRHYETVLVTKAGEPKEVSIALSPVRDAEGNVVGASKIVRDVTVQRRAERAAREHEGQFRRFFDSLSVGMAQADPRTRRLTHVNEVFARITGYSSEELVGMRIADLTHPEDRARDEAAFFEAVADRRPNYDVEKRYVRKDGAVIWVRVAGTILRDESGRPTLAAGVVLDVTDRRLATERLRQSEERFRGLMDQAPFSVQLFSPDGRTIRVNRAWEALWGVTLEQIADYNVLQDPQLEAKGVLPHLRRAFAGEPAVLPEIAYDPNETIPNRTRHTEPVRWVSAVAYPLKDAAGAVREVALIHEDVTARRRAERAVREQAATLSGILAASVDHIYVVDRRGRYRHVSAGGARVLGLEPRDLVGRHWRDLGLPAEVMEPFDAVRERVLSTGVPVREEAVFRGPQGEGRFEYVAAPLRDEEGEADAVVVVSRDVTERTRAEADLARVAAESERRRRLYETILSNTPDLAYVFGLDHRFVYANEVLLRMWGRTWDEAIGKTCLELGYPRWHAEMHDREIDQVVATKRPIRGEVPFTGTFGRRVYEYIFVPVLGEDGEVEAVAGTTRDVTDRKRAEADARFLADASAALADVKDPDETLRTVAWLAVPHFADWCAIDLPDGSSLRRVAVAHADPAKVELARELNRRFPPDPAAPQGVWSILRTGRPEIVREFDDASLERAVPDPELLGILRDLGLRSYIGVPLKVRDRVLGVITFIAAESGRRYDERDLALAEDLARRAAVAVENARLYAELREADRRKDEFLAMLAHELRNPLAPIRSGLDVLRIESAGSDVVDLMTGQVDHLVRLVDDLLDVSRILRGKIELRKEPTDLVSVMRRAAETIRPLAEEHGQRLTVRLPAEPVRLDADPVRLVQVLTNLLHNASKYTDDGGEIRLAAERQGGEAVIRVTDTGIGIAPALLPHVFDLFTQAEQALARSQGGLGIGLTVVRSLVEMHGGTVEAYSAGPGQGSEFLVRLPVAGPAGVDRPEPPRAGPADALRVLVVDDNLPGAKLLAKLLGKLGGHEIRTAHDGEAALAAAEEFRPDLILLDIGLPKLDGYEVARRLRARPEFAATRLVALTGYGTAEDRRKSAAAGFDEHLVKPPGVEALRAVLARPPRAGR